MSVGAQLAMPWSKGLFHRAIPQSGAANTASSLDRAVRTANAFLSIIRTSDSDALRSLSVERLMEAQKKLLIKAAAPDSDIGGMPLQPVIDGGVLPQLPIKQLTQRLQRLLPSDDVPGLVEVYRKALEKRGVPATPHELLSAIQTDRTFRVPAIKLAETQMSRGNPAYNYMFTWTSPAMDGALGACHALEIGFVFGTYEENFSGTGPEADALSRNMQDAWVAFARTGDPSCDNLGRWPAYGERRETMILGSKSALAEAPWEEERRAWDAVPGISTGTF